MIFSGSVNMHTYFQPDLFPADEWLWDLGGNWDVGSQEDASLKLGSI